MRAGVVESVVVGGRDDLHTFELARRAGFAGVEVVLGRDELRSPHGERLTSLRRAKARTGLEVVSVLLGEHSERGGIADASPALAEAAAEDVRRAIGWAADLGSGVVLVPFFGRGEFVGEAGFERCVSAFSALCAPAGEAGVALCYEGLLPADRIRALAERIGSEAFACTFDLGNPISVGLDSPTEIRGLRELIRRVHLKDTRLTRGDCQPGLGGVDFGESARALSETGYDDWLVLETPPGPPELVARDLSFARSHFPALEPAATWPRFGAFSYDFRAGEWERLAESFQRFGLEGVQLGQELLAECIEQPDRIEGFRGMLEARGVSIVALAGYRNLIAPDPAARRANLDWLRSCLELAPRLGTSVVATETGTRSTKGDFMDSPENWGETAWSLLHDAIETLLPVAEEAGTVLAVEATVNNVLRTSGQLLGLLERYPSQHLQVVCDPYNYLSRHLLPAQERVTRAFLHGFEHRFVVAHLKDVGPDGAEVSSPEFGTGVFTQRPYLEFLRARRPDLPLIVEHLPLENIPDAVRRVRTVGLQE
jgi:sugar phosphate isomerase/epimerase